jgi:hypothetical protein
MIGRFDRGQAWCKSLHLQIALWAPLHRHEASPKRVVSITSTALPRKANACLNHGPDALGKCKPPDEFISGVPVPNPRS